MKHQLLATAIAVAGLHASAAGARPLIIGDSVTVAATTQLRELGYAIDAQVGRDMRHGLEQLRAHRPLPSTVVLALGTNGTLRVADIAEALRTVGARRHLVLVTPRELGGHEGPDAQLIRRAGRRHPLRISVVDWARISRGHQHWFARDGIHLTPAGAAAYSRALAPIARDAASAKPPSA